MGKKKPNRFACRRKVFPKSNIYAMRGTTVGIAHPFMGQCLQGKQSAARLPRALIIVSLAAWGKALVLKRSNLVADIRLPVNIGVADHVQLVCLLWGCLAHARVCDVFRMTVLDTGEGVSLD